jgi:hypothetical protein
MEEWDKWDYVYKPKEDIKVEIYENLMIEISLEEFNKVLNTTNNWKAPGNTGISYDLIKHSDNITKEVLVKLMNMCLIKGKMPADWFHGCIYPILKRKDWGGDISLTRSIMLIECCRKLMLKILTLRLTKILKVHNILKGYNFAALKGESCFELIKIVQSILENAILRNKECWMLLMDISKVYDSVSGFLMIKALEHLKLPETFIDLVEQIFYKRKNRVIVNDHYTESYEVGDGLDQGEVWSSILWRIFFDPLLCKLKELEDCTAYNMEAYDIMNINTGTAIKLSEKINHVAFMDDANLISNSKEGLTELYGVCSSFFKLCEINANPKKYELLAISKKLNKHKEADDENESLILDNVKININNTIAGVRFLGIWLNNHASFKSHNNQIENIVKKMINIIKWKRLTAKECVYLWNSVVILMIEYQLQCTVLNNTLVEKLDSKIRNLIKRKCHLAINTSNNIVHDKDFLGCKSIKALQSEALIKGIIYSINNEDLLGRIMKIKIASIKEILWFNGCIFNDIKHIRNNRCKI